MEIKTWTCEGGITTPMIARWKGRIKPNTITSAVAHVVDFMPTFLDVSEAAINANANWAGIFTAAARIGQENGRLSGA